MYCLGPQHEKLGCGGMELAATTRAVRSLVMRGTLLASSLGIALVAIPAPAGSAAPSAGATNPSLNGSLTWSIAPANATQNATTNRSHFQFIGKAGQTLTDRFEVANRSSSTITFNLYSADAYNTRFGGAFALKLSNEKQDDVGGWVTLPTDKIVLTPRTQATVPYTIHIPLNASPGDHAGGIVAQDATPTVVKRGRSAFRSLRARGCVSIRGLWGHSIRLWRLRIHRSSTPTQRLRG